MMKTCEQSNYLANKIKFCSDYAVLNCNNESNISNLVPLILSTKLTIFGLSSLLLAACSKEYIADPMCRSNPQFPADPPAAAACLIRLDNQVLAISPIKGKWQLPTAKAAPDLSAQCTAHRAVWEHSGLNVEVMEKLGTTVANTHIYHCELHSGFDGQTQSFPVPEWANHKIERIELLNPYDTLPTEWSDDVDLIQVRTYFNQIN